MTDESNTERRERRCLRCSKMFDSAHAGNRICPTCDRLNWREYVPPMVPTTVYTDTGRNRIHSEE